MNVQLDRDPKPDHNRQEGSDPAKHGKEDRLNGTFTSVLLLGAFIVVCWVGVFLLFIARA